MNCTWSFLPKPTLLCKLYSKRRSLWYRIDATSTLSAPGIREKLSQYNNITQVRNLIKELPNKNVQLVLESCSTTINLMRNIFHRLSLKEYNINTKDAILEKDIDFDVGLDTKTQGDEGSKELK